MNSATVSAGDTATATQYNNLRKDVVVMAGDYATSGGSSNAYTLSISSQYALAAGTKVKFKANFSNTGSATLNVNSGGAVTIKINGSSDLSSGDILNGQIVECVYDGTYWQMVTVGGTPRQSNITRTFTFGENIDGTTTPQACYYKASDGKIYKADGNASMESSYEFIGFTKENITTNNSGTVITGGFVTGFTGLTDASPYYVSDTAGAISTTPSTTYPVRVGKAIGTTVIQIDKSHKIFQGMVSTLSVPASVGATADTTINTPFRPVKITLKGKMRICDAAGVNCRFLYFDEEFKNTTIIGGILMRGTTAAGGGVPNTIDQVDAGNGTSDEIQIQAAVAGGDRSRLILTINAITATSFTVRLTNTLSAGGGSTSNQRCDLTYIVEG